MTGQDHPVFKTLDVHVAVDNILGFVIIKKRRGRNPSRLKTAGDFPCLSILTVGKLNNKQLMRFIQKLGKLGLPAHTCLASWWYKIIRILMILVGRYTFISIAVVNNLMNASTPLNN